MWFTSIKVETKTKRDDSVELSRFFWGMKQIKYFILALFFVGISSNVFADSLVINYSNNKRLYKWDGTHLINYSDNKRLYKWDGTNITNYSNNKRLYKWDGSVVSAYSTNKRLIKIDGLIPIPILIVLVTGLLWLCFK